MASEIEVASVAIAREDIPLDARADFDTAKQIRADLSLATASLDPKVTAGAEDFELIGASWTDDDGAVHEAFIMLRRDAPAEERDRQLKTLAERCRTAIERNDGSTLKEKPAAEAEEVSPVLEART